MMSSVKAWKLAMSLSCRSISVRTPKTRALEAPASSERFSSSSRRMDLQVEKMSSAMKRGN